MVNDRHEFESPDTVFWFLDDSHGEVMSNSSYEYGAGEASPDESETTLDENEGDEERENNNGVAEDDKSFWETQHRLLQETLCRRSSLESKIRNATKEALKEIQMSPGSECSCGRKPATGDGLCRSCLMREVSGRLRKAGFNSAVCKTKWRSSRDIPSGEHTFIDVLESSSNTKKGEVRVIIELSFRAEFEMARASENYNRLVRRLPEVFVGKVEKLSNIIKILCSAAKKCMKEKKMHMGPWRKQRYMQAKWLGNCERKTCTQHLSMGQNSSRVSKPKASMLSLDLLGRLPNMHYATVEVV